MHTKCFPNKSRNWAAVIGRPEDLTPKAQTELKKLHKFFDSISFIKDGERVVTLYRGTDPREAKEAEDWAKRGQPYTMYGQWWSTDPEEAKKYAQQTRHHDQSGKWALLARDVKLEDLFAGDLLVNQTIWDDYIGFKAKYREHAPYDRHYEVYFERQNSQHFSGYIVFFSGGKAIDANTIRTVAVGDINA
jgi:hypothetical protein